MAGLYIEPRKMIRGGRYWLLGIAVTAMLAILGWILFVWYTTGNRPAYLPFPAVVLADSRIDETKPSMEKVDKYQVDTQHPRYISIPSLSIEKVRVRNTGLVDGRIGISSNIHDAAWYNESSTPGQGYGTVIINGHNKGIERNGAFEGLDGLKDGDEIVIERGDGLVLRYEVVENITQTLNESNKTGLKRLFTPFDKTIEGLGLMTYTGNWIPRDQVFDHRIMVRAILKE